MVDQRVCELFITSASPCERFVVFGCASHADRRIPFDEGRRQLVYSAGYTIPATAFSSKSYALLVKQPAIDLSAPAKLERSSRKSEWCIAPVELRTREPKFGVSWFERAFWRVKVERRATSPAMPVDVD